VLSVRSTLYPSSFFFFFFFFLHLKNDEHKRALIEPNCPNKAQTGLLTELGLELEFGSNLPKINNLARA
jgi:hypothetical protein